MSHDKQQTYLVIRCDCTAGTGTRTACDVVMGSCAVIPVTPDWVALSIDNGINGLERSIGDLPNATPATKPIAS